MLRLTHPTAADSHLLRRKAAMALSRRLQRTIRGGIDLFSHRNDRAPLLVSPFVVGDSDSKAKAKSEGALRSCVNATSGVRLFEATGCSIVGVEPADRPSDRFGVANECDAIAVAQFIFGVWDL